MRLRRLFAWAQRVATEQELERPVPIELERAGDRFAFRVGLQAGFGGQHEARIPVQLRPNPAPHPILKEIHSCEVAGRVLEAANVYALREKARRQIEGIAPGGRLPVAWFRSPAADYDLPVYEDDGEIVCPTLGGRRLKERTLARMREEVGRHLLSAGYLERPEDVVAMVLQPRDLRKVPPAAVIRCYGDERVWLPCVEGVSIEGAVVGVLEGSLRLGGRGRRRGGGPLDPERHHVAPDVISLLRAVRADVAQRDALPDPDALYASEVQPAAVDAAAAHAEDCGLRLLARLEDGSELELPVRRTGAHDFAVAFEDRGVCIYLAPDPEALAAAVRRRLTDAGFLRDGREQEVAPVAEPAEPDVFAQLQEEAHA